MFNYKWHHYTLNRAEGVAVSPGVDPINVVVVGVSLSRAPGPGVPVDRGATKVEDAHVVEREGASGSVVGCAGGPEIVENKTEVGRIFGYPEPDPVVDPEPDPVVEPEPDPVVEPDPDPVPGRLICNDFSTL